MRKSRGADLAYLTTPPPDQARARRMIHDAVESGRHRPRRRCLTP
jgi:hypothetical protein